MKLTELNPKWWSELGRSGQGIRFDCPCAKCRGPAPTHRPPFLISVAFANPLDGGAPVQDKEREYWARTSNTFETLTLAPSIDASKYGHWHGYLTNGEAT